MAKLYKHAYFGDKIIPIEDAHLSIASSAVLYGLSVYTVFQVISSSGALAVFRLKDHYNRLISSAKIIGIDIGEEWTYSHFLRAVKELVQMNALNSRALVRATFHVAELLPGTRSRGLETKLSVFIYEADPILPQKGARLKTSVWRRVPDYAIPSRAKVNGAYVNSVLGKQDALDSGYDDCLFLDAGGHVCELSAANIFIIKDGALITPGNASDILEGINRKTILELAKEMNIPTVERIIDLTELYIADEVFACGTSAFVASVSEIDARKINAGEEGPITAKIKERYFQILDGGDTALNSRYLTFL